MHHLSRSPKPMNLPLSLCQPTNLAILIINCKILKFIYESLKFYFRVSCLNKGRYFFTLETLFKLGHFDIIFVDLGH